MAQDLRQQAVQRRLAQDPADVQLPGGSLVSYIVERVLPEGKLKNILQGFNQPQSVETAISNLPMSGSLVFLRGGQQLVGPLYHGTAMSRLKNILKEGLKPWSETGRRIQRGGGASQQLASYFSRDPTDAIDYAYMAARKEGSKPVLLRARALPTEGLMFDEDAFGSLPKHLQEKALEEIPWQESSGLGSVWRQRAIKKLMEETGTGSSPGALVDNLRLAKHYAAKAGGGKETEKRIAESLASPFRKGTGTVAYPGTVAPKNLRQVWPSPKAAGTGAEFPKDELYDRLTGVLSRAMESYLAKGQPLPWWLR